MAMNQWPVEYADQLVVGNVNSNVAICCLWSNRKRIKNQLSAEKYAVIGNLYSRAGISPMLRNILANPVIRYLVLTGKSFTDSEEALVSFLKRGVDDNRRIAGDHGHIDRDLPLEAVEDVRRNVQLVDLRGVRHFPSEFQRAIRELPILPPFAKPRTFPKMRPAVETFPSEFAGFVVRRPTIMEAWIEILWTVMTFGHVFPTDYGLEQKEVLGLLSVVGNPEPSFGLLPGWAPFKAKDVQKYVNLFFEPDRKQEIAYNYGYRSQSHWGVDQIEALAQELERAGHSRRALISLWDPAEDSRSSEPPCLTTIQAVVREGRLHLAAYIRSNDMFRAYPLNAAALAELQSRVADRIGGIPPGPLMILSFSAHIYSDCWDACKPAKGETDKLRQRFEQDPRGNCVLQTSGARLSAQHFSPEGDLVETFEADDEATLRHRIAPFVSRVDHALYLGKEINRLAFSRSSGESYEQEKVE